MTVASQVKQTLEGLKSVRGTLRIYSEQEQKEEAKAAFNEALEVTGSIIYDLEKRVQVLELQEPQYKGD